MHGPSLRASQPVSSLPRLPEQPDDPEEGPAPTALQNGHSDTPNAQGAESVTRHSADTSKVASGDAASVSRAVDARLPPAGPWGQPGKVASDAQSQQRFPSLANGTARGEGGIASGNEQDGVDFDEGGDESRTLLHKDAERQGQEPPGELADSGDGPSTSGQAASAEGASQPWYKDRNIRLAMLGSGMIAFLYNLGDELTPIYVSAPANIVRPQIPICCTHVRAHTLPL